MKKMWFALCALLLVPTLALANSDMVSISELRQQVERMGRWTASYEAYKRKIEVDIPIDMPEVDAVPCYSRCKEDSCNISKTILCGKWAMFGEQSRTDGKDR